MYTKKKQHKSLLKKILSLSLPPVLTNWNTASNSWNINITGTILDNENVYRVTHFSKTAQRDVHWSLSRHIAGHKQSSIHIYRTSCRHTTLFLTVALLWLGDRIAAQGFVQAEVERLEEDEPDTGEQGVDNPSSYVCSVQLHNITKTRKTVNVHH